MSSIEIQRSKIKKLVALLIIIFIALMILLFSISNTMTSKRKMPNLLSSHKNLAVRGNIISSDNFTIATSKKLFKAIIDIRCLDKDKEELFIKLFSIYSNIKPKEIRTKIKKARKNKRKKVVLSYKIDERFAKNLNELKSKLRNFSVFKPILLNRTKIIYGLTIVESGEKRVYSYADTLSPVLGYVKKFETRSGQTKVNGVKGLEHTYNKLLNDNHDGLIRGERDVLSYIIFNKKSTIQNREDGKELKLNISLNLQRNVEMILDKYKKKFEADEIIVSIMESTTGKIISLATSNRFNPSKIRRRDIQNLNINAIEYQFEPGSIVKPLLISLVMDKNKNIINESFFIHNKGIKNNKGEYPQGKYKIGGWTIHDDHQFKTNYISLEDIIVNSSNIGTLLLAQRLTGQEFYDGFIKFGLSKKTGIDLSYEQTGLLHTLKEYQAGESYRKDNIFKATDSYGQGITVTFMQMLKAYSVFNNNGKAVVPRIIDINTTQLISPIIKKETANIMKNFLIKTVQNGTGRNAKIDGLEIGGKTGTANIVKNKKYQKRYISSFFGFANDYNHKYTIGVTVNNPISSGKHWYYYYAANSAVPIFKELVYSLLKLHYLQQKDYNNE
ncbi:Cell division protein FtsI [Peptidoglycan synthetase] [hydrothermal vent metagenome]|uniref:Cell division protein FtsI [Peptidoglycan synthetase] n=1 Tax=hydrothermal vent metagenome TaxID=652676 RepID=A0A3B1E6U9_9ZZZZ